MSETKFTPGPWHAEWNGNPLLFPFVWQKGGFAVAKMCGKTKSNNCPIFTERDLEDPGKVKANASLIAAAPEMYEKLADICENCGNNGCPETCEFSECNIAEILRKARGEK